MISFAHVRLLAGRLMLMFTMLLLPEIVLDPDMMLWTSLLKPQPPSWRNSATLTFVLFFVDGEYVYQQ